MNDCVRLCVLSVCVNDVYMNRLRWGSFSLTNILRFVVLNDLSKFQIASDDSNLEGIEFDISPTWWGKSGERECSWEYISRELLQAKLLEQKYQLLV